MRLWYADLHQPARVIDLMTAILAPAEQERAAALRGAGARRRFVVARATLRMILADCCGTAAERLVFAYGPDGKPSLAGPDGSAAPSFNVSHAGDVAVFAVAGDRPVGIDVEWTEGTSPIESVARRYLSDAERAWLEAGPAEERRRRFFRIWVRKEAYLKGRGEGISQRIYATDFSRLDGPDRRDAGPLVRDQDRWSVVDLEGLPSGYVASVALARDTS